MIRLRRFALAACLLGGAAQAQSSSPNDLFPPALFAPLPAPHVPDSDLAVVFWFDMRDPLGTLRHQAYDRRAGAYTPAVDAWLRMVRRDYPNYLTRVRYLNVGQRGADEAVRRAVAAERTALADAELDVHSLRGSIRSPARASSIVRRPARTQHRIGIFGAPGSGGIAPNPSASYPFPTPMPYPRPHP